MTVCIYYRNEAGMVTSQSIIDSWTIVSYKSWFTFTYSVSLLYVHLP